MPHNASGPSNDQKSLWDTGFFRIPPSQHAAASQLRTTLRTCANPLGPYLGDVSERRSSEKFRKADVAAVEFHVLNTMGKKDALPALRILKSVIFNLNRRFQKNIPQPTKYDRLTKDPNLLPENFSDVQRRVDAWDQAEKRWVEQNSRFADPGCAAAPVDWEMVVASAALRGGLLSVKRAVAFARALADPHQHFGRSPIRGYADLAVLISGNNEEVVRWYPNCRLQLLISRVSPEEVK
jgi:hypothetical protein